MTGSIAPRDLPVSDAEREHVIGLLQRAVGQGRIDLDQFTIRSGTALEAKTRAELNGVLIDLPGMVLNVPQPAPQPSHAPPPGYPAPAPYGDVLRLSHNWTTRVQRGFWIVPARIEVQGRMGKTVLDLTEARIDHPIVTIDLDCAMSSTTLILPLGATADSTGLNVAGGNLKDRLARPAGMGRPHVVVTGRAPFGTVIIANPRQWGYRR